MDAKTQPVSPVPIEQIELLAGHAPRAIPFHPIAATLVTAALWGEALLRWWLDLVSPAPMIPTLTRPSVLHT